MAGIVDIVRGVTSGLAAPVVDYLKQRQEIRSKERIRKEELKDAAHARRLEQINQGLIADATWELEQIRNSGWKDEYVLVLLSIPLVGVFIPYTQPTILKGFAALETCPAWYRWLILTIFAAIYGIRLYRRNLYDTE